jgi:hypothetical protein
MRPFNWSLHGPVESHQDPFSRYRRTGECAAPDFLDLTKYPQVIVFYTREAFIKRRDYGGVHIDIVSDPAGEEAHAAYEKWRKHFDEETEKIKRSHPE